MSNHIGYNSRFLGGVLPFPTLSATLTKQLAGQVKNRKLTRHDYTHFSVFFHSTRRLPVMSGVNIEGKSYYIDPDKRKKDKWYHDERIEAGLQLGNEFYENDSGAFDRGHLVRRMDPKWGGKQIAKQADKDTFHFLNCCPQHASLNRKIWLELEKNILEKGSVKGKVDLTVFAGPVLKRDDLVFYRLIEEKEIQIPIVFWKVIVWKKEDGSLNAVGFMQSQYQWVKKFLREKGAALAAAKPGILPDDYFEHIEFKDGNTYQVSIPTISKATGIKFDWGNKVKFPYKKRELKKLSRTATKSARSKARAAGVKPDINRASDYEIRGLVL